MAYTLDRSGVHCSRIGRPAGAASWMWMISVQNAGNASFTATACGDIGEIGRIAGRVMQPDRLDVHAN
nr:unnamed protein product [Spirometra erinaceieuropaei]